MSIKETSTQNRRRIVIRISSLKYISRALPLQAVKSFSPFSLCAPVGITVCWINRGAETVATTTALTRDDAETTNERKTKKIINSESK